MKIIGLIIAALLMKAGAEEEKIIKIRQSQLLDLTHPFDAATVGYPGLKSFELTITERGVAPEGYWIQSEDYCGSTHVGTHLDAPCHLAEGQWTVDQIPLGHFVAPAAVVDISSRSKIDRDANVEVEDLMEWENKTNKSLDGTIVLVNSGWGKKWGNEKDFLGSDTPTVLDSLRFPGVSTEAAEWLSKYRRIYALGIDTTSLDNGQSVAHLGAHQALFRANIYGLENLANLHLLPASGAFLFVSPMRLKDEACAAPVRVIALVPNAK